MAFLRQRFHVVGERGHQLISVAHHGRVCGAGVSHTVVASEFTHPVMVQEGNFAGNVESASARNKFPNEVITWNWKKIGKIIRIKSSIRA